MREKAENVQRKTLKELQKAAGLLIRIKTLYNILQDITYDLKKANKKGLKVKYIAVTGSHLPSCPIITLHESQLVRNHHSVLWV